jgi:hypothetical protein
MDTRSKHLRLADLLSQAIVDFAKKKGITIKEARKIFFSAMREQGKKYLAGDTEYDPETDPFHPMHGWSPDP